jgi:hypothetical protein
MELGSYRDDLILVIVKTQSELNYLLNELESLGIRKEKLNELNDVYEIENLVENLKQTFIQDYKSFCEYGVNPCLKEGKTQLSLTHLSVNLVPSN